MNEPTEIQTPDPAENPGTSIAEIEAKKQSIFAEIEAKLAAIPHEIVAEVKALVADLKAHLYWLPSAIS